MSHLGYIVRFWWPLLIVPMGVFVFFAFNHYFFTGVCFAMIFALLGVLTIGILETNLAETKFYEIQAICREVDGKKDE